MPRLVYRNSVAGPRARVDLSKRENMKRLLLVALLAIITDVGARAQDNPAITSQANLNLTADFANASAATKLPAGFLCASRASLAHSAPFSELRTPAGPPDTSAPATPAPTFAY